MAQDKQEIIKEILLDSWEILCNGLDPKLVLRAMIVKRAISKEEYDSIRNTKGTDDQVEKLLRILEEKPASSYENFMEVLQKKAKDLWQKVKDIEDKYQYNRGGTPDKPDAPAKPDVKNVGIKKPDAPAKPDIKNVGIKKIEISWKAPQSDGGSDVTGYTIECRSKPKDSQWGEWQTLCEKVTTHSYSTTGDLQRATDYQFRVYAENKLGRSEPSQPSDSIIPEDKPDAPAKPDVKNVGIKKIEISWKAPQSNGGSDVTGYTIESRRKPEDSQWGEWQTLCEKAILLSAEVNLKTVSGVNGRHCVKRYVNTSQQVTCPFIGSDVTGYTIEYRSKPKDSQWGEWQTVLCEKVPGLTYTADDLEADTEYQFRVCARNKLGLSEPSQPSEGITPEDETPLEIRLRGAEALAAYLEASKEGKKEIRSIRLMLVGQERVGKTSLVKAFMEDRFESGEEITDGVDASKCCSVAFADPSMWKPLQRNRKEHIKQLDKKHDWGVAHAAATMMDPTLADKSTPVPEEEQEHLPPKVAGTPPSPPEDTDVSQHPPQESEQESHKEKKIMTPESSKTPVQPTAPTSEPLNKDTVSKQESEEQKSDDKQVPETKTTSTSSPAKDEETPVEESKDPNKESASTSAKDETTPIEESKDPNKAKEQPAEIPENIRKATEQADDLEVTFWDFAGQDLYYTTHQVFFNRRAVFALVFDMSKKLEESCEVRDFSIEFSVKIQNIYEL
ncbi:uncharacterized protein [Amphiura filiformis]|uniref:uncharacterized protein n=1 Tax=Amphiura filiformis TaxID=82378 RepID=UPI003B21D39A